MAASPALAPALEARQEALHLIEAALARRGGLDEALGAPRYMALSPLDRGFARAVVMAALRQLGPIDKILDGKLKREPPARVRHLLRLGLAQAFWLDTPAFAAVDTTVALTPQPLRGLVNAIMRGALRDGAPAVDPRDLAPAWLMARWRSAFGEADALAVAAEIAKEPATDLTLRAAGDGEVTALLEAEAIAGGTVRLRRRGDVAQWPGYAEGRWWVQDAAAAIPARLARGLDGGRALDMCAAPGGKTLQLAAAGAKVTALDKSAGRLRRLAAGLERTGLAAEMIAADAATWDGGTAAFDAVLLDAPCSSTGAFRRHPDVLWNARPGDLAPLSATQARLLTAAAGKVKAGGCLVYSVCSLETEEGEAQVRRFLDLNPDFALDPLTPGEGGSPLASLAREGWLRILPHHLAGGIDGFFIARFSRAR